MESIQNRNAVKSLYRLFKKASKKFHTYSEAQTYAMHIAQLIYLFIYSRKFPFIEALSYEYKALEKT